LVGRAGRSTRTPWRLSGPLRRTCSSERQRGAGEEPGAVPSLRHCWPSGWARVYRAASAHAQGPCTGTHGGDHGRKPRRAAQDSPARHGEQRPPCGGGAGGKHTEASHALQPLPTAPLLCWQGRALVPRFITISTPSSPPTPSLHPSLSFLHPSSPPSRPRRRRLWPCPRPVLGLRGVIHGFVYSW
jgi:hypothetical protein